MKRLQICVLYDDLIHKILERLPIKALVRFKSVCKPWKKMIQEEPYLALTQMRRPIEEYTNPKLLMVYASNKGINKFTAVISKEMIEIATPCNRGHCLDCYCNGLYLFYHFRHDHDLPLIILFNPLTQEALELPASPRSHEYIFKKDIVHGLGFDVENAIFKVIRLTMDLDSMCCKPEILILGKKSWKKLQLPACLQGMVPRRSAIYANGAIHWLFERPGGRRGHHPNIIVAFDVKKEEFRSIKFHHPLTDDSTLINIGVSLAVCVGRPSADHHARRPPQRYIWLLKDYENGRWCGEREVITTRGKKSTHRVVTGAWGNRIALSNYRSYLFFDFKSRVRIAKEILVEIAYMRKFVVNAPRDQLSLLPLSQYSTRASPNPTESQRLWSKNQDQLADQEALEPFQEQWEQMEAQLAAQLGL